MYRVYGEGDKYFRAASGANAALPRCPFCGQKHGWEMEAEEAFSVTYRIRCKACGGVLSLKSMSADPFREPFLTVNAVDTGTVNASGLLVNSLYSVEALNDAAERITAEQPGQSAGARAAEITPDTARRAADSQVEQTTTAAPRTAPPQDGNAHREKHESAGICQDSHVFGEHTQPEPSAARVVSFEDDGDSAHREEHEAEGACQDSHVFGERTQPEPSAARVISSENDGDAHQEEHAGACQDDHVYGEPQQRPFIYPPEYTEPIQPPDDWDPFGHFPKKPKWVKGVVAIVIALPVLIFIIVVMVKMFAIANRFSLSTPRETVVTVAATQEFETQNVVIAYGEQIEPVWQSKRQPL